MRSVKTRNAVLGSNPPVPQQVTRGVGYGRVHGIFVAQSRNKEEA